jgi:hypothetical protein
MKFLFLLSIAIAVFFDAFTTGSSLRELPIGPAPGLPTSAPEVCALPGDKIAEAQAYVPSVIDKINTTPCEEVPKLIPIYAAFTASFNFIKDKCSYNTQLVDAISSGEGQVAAAFQAAVAKCAGYVPPPL